MSHKNCLLLPGDVENLPRISEADSSSETCVHQEQHRYPQRLSLTDRLCVGAHHLETGPADTPSPDASGHHFCHYTPKCFFGVHRVCTGGHVTSARSSPPRNGEEGWHECTTRTTIRVDNEVEAHREANNYKFGFRKWKASVTEKPIEDQSEIMKELHSDLSIVKAQERLGSVVTFGNVCYVFLFGWWIALIYILISAVMFLTVAGATYGKVCVTLAWYFIWPFGKCIEKVDNVLNRLSVNPPNCEVIPHETDSEEPVMNKDSASLVSSPPHIQIPVPELPPKNTSKHWCRVSTCIWLLLGYPVLAVMHCLACVLSWLLVFTIPVAKINARILTGVLLMAPEDLHIHTLEKDKTQACGTRVLLCCYQAFNMHYYKYTVHGINIFALNLLPLVFITLIIGYADKGNNYFRAETKFATAMISIIPLSYYVGMGIASISAQCNFAVGAVVNATFGSITELTFYITALLQGHRAATKCYEEVVKAALTGTLLGCILFIPGICMIIGGIKHQEQRFNSRSAGVSSALLFISIGGVFAPTLFSKTFGNLMCESCSDVPSNATVSFVCKNCHYDTSQSEPHLILSHIEPLMYTISVLLPAAYLIGLIFTLKTHSHIYDIHISDGHGGHAHGQYAQEGTSTSNPTGEISTGHLLVTKPCINASIIAHGPRCNRCVAYMHVVHAVL